MHYQKHQKPQPKTKIAKKTRQKHERTKPISAEQTIGCFSEQNKNSCLEIIDPQLFFDRAGHKFEKAIYISAFQDYEIGLWISFQQLLMLKRDYENSPNATLKQKLFDLEQKIGSFRRLKDARQAAYEFIQTQKLIRQQVEEEQELKRKEEAELAIELKKEQERERLAKEQLVLAAEVKQQQEKMHETLTLLNSLQEKNKKALVSLQAEFELSQNDFSKVRQASEELKKFGGTKTFSNNVKTFNKTQTKLKEQITYFEKILMTALPLSSELKTVQEQLKLMQEMAQSLKHNASTLKETQGRANEHCTQAISIKNAAQQKLVTYSTEAKSILEQLNQHHQEVTTECEKHTANLSQLNNDEASIRTVLERIAEVNTEIAAEYKILQDLVEQTVPFEAKTTASEIETKILQIRNQTLIDVKNALAAHDETLRAELEAKQLVSDLTRLTNPKEAEVLLKNAANLAEKSKKAKEKLLHLKPRNLTNALNNAEIAKKLALLQLLEVRNKIRQAKEKIKKDKQLRLKRKFRLLLSCSSEFSSAGKTLRKRQEEKAAAEAKRKLEDDAFNLIGKSDFEQSDMESPALRGASSSDLDSSDFHLQSPGGKKVENVEQKEVKKLSAMCEKYFFTNKYLIHPPLTAHLTSLAEQKIEALGVGGAIRDPLLNRQLHRVYKDKLENDLDITANITDHGQLIYAFWKPELPQELCPQRLGKSGIYLIPDAKTKEKEDLGTEVIFDSTQVMHSNYFKRKADGTFVFADPIRADYLSRDLTINGFYCDQDDRIFALPEAKEALEKKEIAIVNKLELKKMEAEAYGTAFDEKLYGGKTSEQIAYESDIRILLRGLLAASYGDLHYSDSFKKSFDIGKQILQKVLQYPPQSVVKVEQINTLLQEKIFKLEFKGAQTRFKIFEDNGIIDILFPGLLTAIAKNQSRAKLNKLLEKASSLEEVYMGLLVLQYQKDITYNLFFNTKDFYKFIKEKAKENTLIYTYVNSYIERTKRNTGLPYLTDLFRNCLNLFDIKAPKPSQRPVQQPVGQMYYFYQQPLPESKQPTTNAYLTNRQRLPTS